MFSDFVREMFPPISHIKERNGEKQATSISAAVVLKFKNQYKSSYRDKENKRCVLATA